MLPWWVDKEWKDVCSVLLDDVLEDILDDVSDAVLDVSDDDELNKKFTDWDWLKCES